MPHLMTSFGALQKTGLTGSDYPRNLLWHNGKNTLKMPSKAVDKELLKDILAVYIARL